MPVTKTINFLPAIFQTETNRKFLNATLDQLVTEPNVTPINGYIGRKFAPGFKSLSSYVKEPTVDRSEYQLEPAVVTRNAVTDEVEFLCTYPETLQKINFYGGATTDPNLLWESEYYSYYPYINFDSFVNYGQYYWLPDGPAPVDVYAGSVQLEQTFYPFLDTVSGVYTVNNYDTVTNPDLVLARGGTYQFKVNQPGNEFWLQTDPGINGKQLVNTNLSSRQVLGVVNNGAEQGTVTFNIPTKTAQDFYINMPVVQQVDLVTTLKFIDIQGQLLSVFNSKHGGIDGQFGNLNNKYIIFGNYYPEDNDWNPGGLFDGTTEGGFDVVGYDYGLTVDPTQRYGIWQIKIVPDIDSSEYIITLVYKSAIPINNKVLILSGTTYGNTQWFTDSNERLTLIPIITANLDNLYYQSGSTATAVGKIKLVDVGNNSIDVTSEILGKTNYISPNGVTFTNGLKIKFDVNITPAKYQNKEFYIEGVGSEINLVSVNDLVVNFASGRASYMPDSAFTFAAQANLNAAQDALTISSTDFPDLTTLLAGTFPNRFNAEYIVEQALDFTIPYRGGLDAQGDHASKVLETGFIGMTLPGIVINGVSNGWYVPGTNIEWHYDTNFASINGQDAYGGYPDEDGKYNYRSSQFITANAWGNVSGFTTGYVNTDGHSKIIGFAADGYPIYGPLGYLNPSESSSGVIRMRSSYSAGTGGISRPESKTVTLTANVVSADTLTLNSASGLNPGMRITVNSASLPEETYWIMHAGQSTAIGPTVPSSLPLGTNQVRLNSNLTLYAGTTLTFEFLPGSFIEDYSYVQGSGTLDQYNGRYCITPDFPNGTYAYFATQDVDNNPVYPYVIGSAFYGSIGVDTNTSLTTPDYLMINRASRDLNPWSRRNRWFHKDVIASAAYYNGKEPVYDQQNRAVRPIIEFKQNLKLFNFGIKGLQPIDLLDNITTEPFLTIEGAQAAFVDGVNIIQGMRIIFSADEDPSTRGKIWVVSFIDTDLSSTTNSVVHLTLAEDGAVQENDTVSVFNGITNAGKSYYYDGASWIQGQIKSTVNQAPLFDVLDSDGTSFSDRNKYPISNTGQAFNGTAVFGYKTGTGTVDPVLGFALSYKNFNNIGDIQFVNYFDSGTFVYSIDKVDYTKKVNTGFLIEIKSDYSFQHRNPWVTVVRPTTQYQDISYIYDGAINQFDIDVSPNADVDVPNLKVYVNFKVVADNSYRVYEIGNGKKQIWINAKFLKAGDKIDIFINSQSTSALGFYDVPVNLEFNAQNQVISDLTLGEMRNHIGQLTRNSLSFDGVYPGDSNLRDVEVQAQGGTMLQQSAPATFAPLFLSNDKFNFVNSVQYAQQEYTRFKNKFLSLAATGSKTAQENPVTVVDNIVIRINEVKNSTFPWYYSDMVPYANDRNIINYTVLDPNQRNYEITSVFDPTAVSNKAVLVYVNKVQLVTNRDYEFLSARAGIFIKDTFSLTLNDKLTIFEYNNTDGCYVPETPTKLGLYPKFTPEIITDYSYTIPQQFIRGHDGSMTPVFNDFRDNLLLELEKRIYNNIKVNYNEHLVNIYESKPGRFRNNYSLADYNRLTGRGFLPWVGNNRLNYNSNTGFNETNAWTYNYSTGKDVIDGELLPGSWRACYEYFYDCQTPNETPWEMLGFSEKPTWWEDQYGPAPYTSGNKILWDDLEAGYIAQGDRQGNDSLFARPGLSAIIPVTENGDLRPPIGLLTRSYTDIDFRRNWSVGQWGPVETAWRKSSEFPYAQQIVSALTKPAKYFAYGIVTNKYRFDTSVNQYKITDTNTRITQDDIMVNGHINSDNSIDRSTGYLNWISDYQTHLGLIDKNVLLDYVKKYSLNLTYRMAGFSNKNTLKVVADQNSPDSINQSVIVPDANFDLYLNKSTPITNVTYSAVIIEKTATGGYSVNGYDNNSPYFSMVPPATTGKTRTVTVLNQSFQYYQEFNNYRINIPYGTVFTNLQQVATFLCGYERWLQIQGLRFDYYDQDLGQIRDWTLSTKEFVFWSQQGWAAGSVIVVGPAAGRLKYINNNAVIDAIENTYFGSKVMTQAFTTLGSDAYTVVRNNNQFNLLLDSSTDLIAFASLNVVQFEHALIFDNVTEFNDLIFNPTLGQRQFKLKLVGSKTGEWTGALSAAGYMYNGTQVNQWQQNVDYLRGDLVDYKNFYYAAKTDVVGSMEFNFSNWLPVEKSKIKFGLLPNFATNAGRFTDFYDVNNVNLEDQFDIYGLGLIGYRNRSYLNDLGLDDATQVKLYQGYIKQKGSKNAINALGQIDVNGDTTQLQIDENWAFRVGAYGSLDINQYVELVLDESYTLSNPTSLEVTSNNSVIYSSIYSNNDGLYKSSKTPFTQPFLINRTADSNTSEDIQTAGFVNLEDVDFTIFDLVDPTSLSGNIATVGVGNTIWTALDYNRTWNVFRVDEVGAQVTMISTALDGRLKITTSSPTNLKLNDTVIINTKDRFAGMYKIIRLEGKSNFLVDFKGILGGFSQQPYDNATLYLLNSLKLTYASQVKSVTPTEGWKTNNKVWVSANTTSNEWAVYEKSEPWNPIGFLPESSPTPNGFFGSSVSLSKNNNFAVAAQPGGDSNRGVIVNYIVDQNNEFAEDVRKSSDIVDIVGLGSGLISGKDIVVASAPGSKSGKGLVIVYERNILGTLDQKQIVSANIANAQAFGSSLSISDDDQWLYVAAPNADRVYVYEYNSTADREVETITGNGSANLFALSFTPVATELLSVIGVSVEYVPYIDFNVVNANITFVTPPSGAITVRQNPGYQYYTTLSYANTGSQFGYSIATSTDGKQLLVGAPLATVTSGNVSYTSAGTVSIYDRSVEKFISQGQTLFGGLSALSVLNKVYVGDTLQVLGTDYTIVASTWIQFATAPLAGSVVSIETNRFNLVEEIHANDPQTSSQFGYSVDLCNNNCSLYAGAPYYTADGNKYQVGTAYRFLNQAKVYGNIIGTVQNPTVTSGSYIRLNDYAVQLVQTSLDGVVLDINQAGVPGITAANVNGYLSLTSDSRVASDKLQVLPCIGNPITQLGLDIFTETERIANPTATNYDRFGKIVKISDGSIILAVASDDANSILTTTVDVYNEPFARSVSVFGTPYINDAQSELRYSATTFDADSTTFTEMTDSGAVWIMNLLTDSRQDIDNAGTFNYVQQLIPSKLNLPVPPNIKFGASVDVNDFTLLVGSTTESSYGTNSGRVFEFTDPARLNGWDVIRNQEPKVDINCLIKNYVYSNNDQSILYNLDYIDPAKGKVLGIAEQEITYKTDYDPAIYNNSTSNELSTSKTYFWSDIQVGQVWWDLSAVKYIDYEQSTIKYRTANWGAVFPGSSIDVCEWVESIYPPTQYVANGGDGQPKYANNAAYVTLAYVDPNSNYTTVKYYFWVKNKISVPSGTAGRNISTVTVADYLTNPKNSGVKYLAAVKDNAVAVYNIVGDVTGTDTILHVDYAVKLSDTIIHSEYALLSESGSKSGSIPTTIYNKLVDSVSGVDKFGYPVPDPTLPVQSRYGIDIRPRQSMFVNKNDAVQTMIVYVNNVFNTNAISEGYDLSTLSAGEEIPPANSGYYDLIVNNVEELGYINIITQPVGYEVLVLSDSTVGDLWTIYTKQATNTWKLTRVQSYRTTDYWKYVDWYATGYDNSVIPDFTVNSYADMSRLKLKSGNVVKILNNGQGKWNLVRVFSNATVTIGIENGTINLTDNLYELDKYGLSFDNDNFDSQRFDQNPSIELRKILEALHDDLFVNELDPNFMELFFVFVYFVLDEQKYVDWVFKTSFIDVIHQIKGLTQPQIFASDNQEYIRQYIDEVKPFHTTVREYIVNYQGVDNINLYTSDYDVPAYYDSVYGTYRSPSGEYVQDTAALQQIQYRDWLLNYPYSVGSIIVTNGGSGYTLAPQVTITGSTIGNDAVARALITNGVVVKIQVLYKGSNYVTNPVITISGGNGTGARAYAFLDNDVIRKVKTTLVYDRTTYGTGGELWEPQTTYTKLDKIIYSGTLYYVDSTKLPVNANTFTSGSSFDSSYLTALGPATVITWQPNTSYSSGTVISYDNKSYFVNQDFTSTSSFIGNDLKLYAAENFDNANDRISAYYDPATGMPGKDFSLLQSGIDYPGVVVDGPLYTDAGGFDVGGFDSSAFDSLEIDVDGTYVISDTVLDTKISSEYTDMALGVRPEDIIIDGGEFVDGYSSHAPEELVPGRVFDTVDITVKTFATNAASSAYSTWVSTTAFSLSEIVIVDGGTGYTAGNVSVTLANASGYGYAFSTTLNANGSVTSITVASPGTGFTTIPNVVITGANTGPAVASARLTQSTYDTFEYRIFKSMGSTIYNPFKDKANDYTFYRIDNTATTTLASNLSLTANTISVVNSGVLMTPSPSTGIPGVVMIDGERITYFGKNDSTNTLSQIRRGTQGTGAKAHLTGVTVIDSGQTQSVPYSKVTSDSNLSALAITTAGLFTVFTPGIEYLQSKLWYSIGSAPEELTTEFVANTVANVVTTESSIMLTTDDTRPAPADGNGLYASATVQAVFIKTA
jgi:hypothetical protein